jgi:hypothetical protein
MFGDSETNTAQQLPEENSAFAGQISMLPQKPAAIISRDEMNLAEFPLTVLSTRSDSKIKTLEFSDTIYNKNGSPVQRRWIITGADKFGLPTASDEEILLGLLKLTVDSGFTERKVFFTRYELLRILRWTTEGRSYSRLQNALDRLSGVRIKASNAFFDNESKAHSTRNFGIVDAYEINDGRDSNTKPSFFIWSDVLFKSFQAGFIKKLDLDYYLNLESAVSRRLYRYLDKHFWYKSQIKINLFTLAHEKIGISRNYKFPSSLRQQIDPAFEELISKGFVESVEYMGKGKGTEVCINARSSKKAANTHAVGRAKAREEEGLFHSEKNAGVGKEAAQQSTTSNPAHLVLKIQQALIDRGLKTKVAERLLAEKDEQALQRIDRIIRYVDELSTQKSRLVSKNPQGFLYRAVERCEQFVLPDDPKESTAKAAAGAEQRRAGEKSLNKQKSQAEYANQEAHYLVFRKHEIQRLREQADPSVVAEFTNKIRSALKNISGLISAEKFDLAVEHAVDEKLAKLFAVPSFEEWGKK